MLSTLTFGLHLLLALLHLASASIGAGNGQNDQPQFPIGRKIEYITL